MFDSLSTRLQDVFKSLKGEVRLTEETVEIALREIRMALLEADVNFKVVKAFIDRVRDKAVDQAVLRSLTPAQQVVRIVRDEMLALFGDSQGGLPASQARPRVILLLGLQGSGKTTTTGKLAYWLAKQGRHPLLVSTDVRRPAAIEQLSVVAKQAGVKVHNPAGEMDPVKRASGALTEARNAGFDIVIVDTAGRLHIDDDLMVELQAIKEATQPTDLLYVADAMTGQDAIKSAGEFNRRMGVTGVVLSKMDGDARGGAALSVVGVVGVPIAFAGSGERLQDLEPFHPDRVVSRVLGMGDVLSLIEKAEEVGFGRGRRAAGREAAAQRVHARGFSRPAPDDQEDGAARTDSRDDPRAWANLKQLTANRDAARRQAARAHRSDDQLDDAAGAAQPSGDQRQPPEADREGQRQVGRRSQPAAEAVRADEEDAEAARGHGRPRQEARRPRDDEVVDAVKAMAGGLRSASERSEA